MGQIKKILNSQKVAPYVFVLPFILTFGIFFIYPLFNTTIMSFQEIVPGQSKFIGIENYRKIFRDPIFWKSVINTLKYTMGTLLILIPFPMLVACVLNSKAMIGQNIFKSTLFIPALTSVVVAGTVFRLIFGELPGALLNQIIAQFGFEPVKWLRHSNTAFFALFTLATWRWLGVNTLYFLAGLQSIPGEIYESADIDGANAWQKFLAITVPMLKPTTVYVLTISIYGGFAMFTESYMLWAGKASPQNIGTTIVGYLYRQGIEKNRMGYASAVGLVLLAVMMTINIIQLKMNGSFKKEVD